MAYDNYENTAFDLNHDGKIDSSEASFIEDTFYEDHHGVSTGFDEDDDSDVCYGSSGYSKLNGNNKANADIEQLRKSIQARKQNRVLITIGVIAAIWIFVGNNIAGALILFGLYILGSIYDFWH